MNTVKFGKHWEMCGSYAKKNYSTNEIAQIMHQQAYLSQTNHNILQALFPVRLIGRNYS